MIDHDARKVYVDFSGLSAFQSCKEKGRLAYEEGYRPLPQYVKMGALDFGHAFHAGVAAYYDAEAGLTRGADGTWSIIETPDSIMYAKAAFVLDLEAQESTLPLLLESKDRRSVERGLAMLDAYLERWKNDRYTNILDGAGRPLVEVSFRFKIGLFFINGIEYEIWYCGTIDRLMANASGNPVIFETKTTTQGLSQFILQCKPNDQVTRYFRGAKQYVPRVQEAVWDCAFISSRQPDMAKAMRSRHWLYGVDVNADFARVTTNRSEDEVSESLENLRETAQEYCQWAFSGKEWWPQTAPGACHSYGGCWFRDVCTKSRENRPAMLASRYTIQKWDPRGKPHVA